MAEHALEWFIGTQSSRCSRDQRRLLFIWWAGVSTSPLQLLAYGGGGGGRGAPLKRFWVYVQEYGITLSSVLTAKHDSTANFWPEIKLQENDKKTNKQSARLLANWCSWCFRWREQSALEKVIPLFDYEKWFCALVCLVSLHYNFYSLHTLQRHAELQ